MQLDIYAFVEALWLILPAYAANGLVPLLGLRKTLHPMDFGKRFPDGRRILGDGKTWEGLVAGCVTGAAIGSVEMFAFPYLPWELSPVELVLVPMGPVLGFFLGTGAMLGDAAASFVKRRLGIGRGRPAPVLDQDDFVVGALLAASLIVSTRPEWWIILLVLTPLFHLAANAIGFLLGVKKQPW